MRYKSSSEFFSITMYSFLPTPGLSKPLFFRARHFSDAVDVSRNPPAAGDELFFAENKAYAVGSVPDVQWVTDEDAYNIFLWQQSLGVESAAEGSGRYTVRQATALLVCSLLHALWRSYLLTSSYFQPKYSAQRKKDDFPGQSPWASSASISRTSSSWH